MRKVLFAVCALVLGACTQVDSDDYIREHGRASKSDGVFQQTSTHGLEAHINGYRLNSLTKAIYEDFTEYGDGDMYCMQNDWTACSAANTEINLLQFPSGNKVAQVNIAQNDAGADMDAGSLDISGDQTAADGLEMVWGMYGATGGAFIIGEDPAFFTCGKFTVADASGTDEFHIGFRRAEIFNATFDNYLDLATIGLVGSANPNNIQIETIDDNAATTTTDTTLNWADGGTHTLCVYISAAGVVTYTVDDSAPPTTAAFTWDDGDPVVPFIHFMQHANLTEEVDLLEWKVGYSD